MADFSQKSEHKERIVNFSLIPDHTTLLTLEKTLKTTNFCDFIWKMHNIENKIFSRKYTQNCSKSVHILNVKIGVLKAGSMETITWYCDSKSLTGYHEKINGRCKNIYEQCVIFSWFNGAEPENIKRTPFRNSYVGWFPFSARLWLLKHGHWISYP